MFCKRLCKRQEQRRRAERLRPMHNDDRFLAAARARAALERQEQRRAETAERLRPIHNDDDNDRFLAAARAALERQPLGPFGPVMWQQQPTRLPAQPPVELQSRERLAESRAQKPLIIDKCSICLIDFGTEPLASLNCRHVFHKNCLINNTNNKCPICRSLYLNDFSFGHKKFKRSKRLSKSKKGLRKSNL